MKTKRDHVYKSGHKDYNDLDTMRHSAAHLMALAVMELYPGTKLGIGPTTEQGFYYDFALPAKLSESDLTAIEEKMKALQKQALGFTRVELSIANAKVKAQKDHQPLKEELLEDLKEKDEAVTLYETGHFWDLCKGPHVPSTAEIGPFKLLSIAGAYWKGDEHNPMLTRIYGTAFFTQEELDAYLAQLAEAKKRDHRKLGKELDLFTFSELVGKGLPLYTQKGALIRRLLNEYVESVQSKQGYMQVWTPQLARGELFKISGHYDKYKENLFQVKSNYSDEELFLKPMNCPQHTQIYASKPRSYRDLPIRMTDFAMLYRDEKPGELNGLARVRSFSQDDCHVFCREDQVDTEVDRALSMTKEIMKTFGFTYRYRLSIRDKAHPEKYVGDPKIWDKVEAWAETIMKRNGIDYFDGPGEAAFYAPKMDLMATDALGREWQLSTVQIDYFLPERFGLTYIDQDGKEKRPIMIHRAIIGSPERFIMVLLEHFAGAFPTWLSPVQVKVLPIADRHGDYASDVINTLKKAGVRAELDDRKETLQAKIRDAQLEKVNYMLIVGDKEMADATVSIRKRGGKDMGVRPLDTFVTQITEEITSRALGE